MAQVHRVAKCHKSPGDCLKCGAEIKIGDPYKWTAPRAAKAFQGHKRIACGACSFTAADTTTSKMGAVYEAQDVARAAIASGSATTRPGPPPCSRCFAPSCGDLRRM